MKEYIPNFSTLSTLIDRLSIENVKLSHFENEIEHDNPSTDARKALEKKIITQNKIIYDLKNELTIFMEKIFVDKDYSFSTEERTFK